MIKYALNATSPMNGFAIGDEKFQVTELTIGSLHALAASGKSIDALRAILIDYGLDLPDAQGLFSDQEISIFAAGRDQWFLMDSQGNLSLIDKIKMQLADQVAITDQSDAWGCLKLSGTEVRDHLERLCPLDIHPESFPIGMVARTMMEHLNTIIIHHAQNEFLILCARSSAHSFSHMFTE